MCVMTVTSEPAMQELDKDASNRHVKRRNGQAEPEQDLG